MPNIIYLLDSGIEVTHNTFKNKNIQLCYSYTGEFIDVHGHGTNNASHIVGEFCPLSNIELRMINVEDESGPSRISITKSIEYIIYQIKHQKIYPVVCMPWMIESAEWIIPLINELSSIAIVVTAAGNLYKTMNNYYPCGLKNVVTVGSHNNEYKISKFNNKGNINVFDLGMDVTCAMINNTYKTIRGNSVSSAIVSAKLSQYVALYSKNAVTEFYNDCNNDLIWQEDKYLENAMRSPTYEHILHRLETS